MEQYIDLTEDTPESNTVEQSYPLRASSVEEIEPSDWEASLEQQAVLEESDGDCEIPSDINPSVSDENFFTNYQSPFESISLALRPPSSVASRPTLIYK